MFKEKPSIAAETPEKEQSEGSIEQSNAAESSSKTEKVKGILVKIGETIKEYAPAAIIGAAGGAIAFAMEQAGMKLDESIITTLTNSENIQAFFMAGRHLSFDWANNPAIIVTACTGLSILMKKLKNMFPDKGYHDDNAGYEPVDN